MHIPFIGSNLQYTFATKVSIPTFIITILGLTPGTNTLTLKVLKALLHPIILGRIALSDFVEHKTAPNLLKAYSYEVGEILRNIPYTNACLDEADKEKESPPN
jgi:hypothetical protein